MGVLMGVVLTVTGSAGGHRAATGSVPTLTGSPNVCLADLVGSEGWCGDGGPAAAAKLRAPAAVAALPGGGFLIADSGNDVIRRVDDGGLISTVAGVGFAGSGPANASAVKTRLSAPSGVAVLPLGGYVIADTGNHKVREVHPTGRISTIAGNGVDASSGDGGPAVHASLQSPQGLAVAADGSIVIADPAADRVRLVRPNGRIETLAGTGKRGFGGDGGPALSASLDYPTGVAIEPDGSVLIADDGNYRVRRVATDGTISTVAGGGSGPSGAGTTTAGTTAGATTQATQLQLNGPTDVAVTSNGGFVIADGPVVERVASDGNATVIAGTGKPDYRAAAGPATATGLADATGVDMQPNGALLIADDNTNRVRGLDANGALTTLAGSGTPQQVVAVGSNSCPNPHINPPWEALDLKPWIGSPPTSPAGKPIRVTFETSLAARITIRVTRRNRLITSRAGAFRPGTHTTHLGRAPAPGSYSMTISGRARLSGRLLSNCAATFLNVVRGG